jgi:hypothetical protein
LTDKQLRALRAISARTGDSAAELIRRGVDLYLAGQAAVDEEDKLERALRIAGKYRSGVSNVSADHDRYLAEAFLK